jgi:NADPH-dependent curcumin reductase CurA
MVSRLSSMAARRNRRVLLRARPDGAPRESDFACDEVPVPELPDGHFLVRNRYLSIDAGFRQWMNEGAGDAYMQAMVLGEPVVGLVLGEVAESRHPEHAVGTLLMGRTRWEEWSLADGSDYMAPVTAVPGVGLSHHLGALGPTGLTAYFGLRDVGRPQPGETVVVSTAAGAVGSVAAQIAKIRGCRVVGLASTEEKCRWLVDELGLDAAVEYRSPGSLEAGLDRHCPDGIDVYFDNVGGRVLDAALQRLALHARVVMCGALASYDAVEPPPGPRHLFKVVTQRASMQGFMVTDYVSEYPAAVAELSEWIAQGRLRPAEQVVEGIEHTPRAFCDMFRGVNRGKLVVRLPATGETP